MGVVLRNIFARCCPLTLLFSTHNKYGCTYYGLFITLQLHVVPVRFSRNLLLQQDMLTLRMDFHRI